MTRVAILLAFALTGCTTASTTMLSENTALINAQDLSTGSRAAVRQKALIAAARTAQARGYDYFGIVQLSEKSSQNWVEGGHSAQSGGNPGTAVSIPTLDLNADMKVRFLHANELPADRDGIYQASDILAGLK